MADQADPLMKRIEVDGHKLLLTVDWEVSEPYPKSGTDKEKKSVA